MKIPGHVEPGAVVVVDDVHDQRVAFPAAARVTHPEVHAGTSGLSVGIDEAEHRRPLEGDRDVLGCLENLKWKLHVHDPGDAGHITTRQRIGRLPVREVLELFRRGRRLVRNLAAFDDSLACGHPIPCGMILKIVGCPVADLPNPLEVRFAVGSARQRLGSAACLHARRDARTREHAECNEKDNRKPSPTAHVERPDCGPLPRICWTSTVCPQEISSAGIPRAAAKR